MWNKYKTILKLPFLLAFIVPFSVTNILFAQDNQYDQELAEELGADDYGMRSYVFVTLLTGGAIIEDEKKRSELFRGHFANMTRLAEMGKLVLAGPFGEGGDKRGLLILNVTEIDDAKVLVEMDPAVDAGIFKAEYIKYYGSAALMKINELHGKIQKTKIE